MDGATDGGADVVRHALLQAADVIQRRDEGPAAGRWEDKAENGRDAVTQAPEWVSMCCMETDGLV